jgi:hypothetical protein
MATRLTEPLWDIGDIVKLIEKLGGMIMDSSTKRLLAYSLTIMLLSLPSLAFAQAQTSATSPNSTGGETAAHEGAGGDDAIYCRPPEQRTDLG